MFLNDVNKKEEIRVIAIEHLKKSGIKYKSKKVQSHSVQPQVGRCAKKFFKVPLQFLETETVTLVNGQQLKIPKRIHELCLFILTKVQTEGIFRKEGSKSRQVQIKLSLDKGHPLGHEHHVIDVAVVLKSFLRDLPEPLIPPSHKDLFLMCSVGKKPKEHILKCLLLACLLLPAENLNILSYLMQFFNEVANYADSNKMNYGNLSILVGPNIFPIDDKLVPKSSLVITKICDITKLLIENAENIGIIPDFITEQLLLQVSSSDDNNTNNIEKKKNKRRSGSLTRMLSGWKKIVSINKSEEENNVAAIHHHHHHQPLIYTPIIENSSKKRKVTRLSLKKKKDNDNFNVPFTPLRTPVSINPKGKKSAEDSDQSLQEIKEPKLKNHWYMRTRSMKSLLKDNDSSSSSSINSSISSSRRNSILGQKSLLERRWSAVSNAATFKRKKRISCSNLSKISANIEADYVRVPKTEFEDFKHRVSAIERRISIELDLVQQHKEKTPLKSNNIENVQNAYEKTLENASLSPRTDQLARKFTKDLKIRRSFEQKIIRSPSARKIGVIRRRSTERERRNVQIIRNQSWNVSRQKILVEEREKKQKNAMENLEEWKNAPGYFSASKSNIIEDNNCVGNPNRASIVKLRSQNVGMVREKAKLFGELKDADYSTDSAISQNNNFSSSNSRKMENSIETPKYVKMLQIDETRAKKSLSPRNKYVNTPQKHKLQQIGRQYAKIQRKSPQDSLDLRSPRRRILLADETLTPNNNNNNNNIKNNSENLPQIKAPLPIKTPKRLCRTPAIIINNNNRKTPLKAFATTPL